MHIENAKTLVPTYERGILQNGEEIAPDVYMDHLPKNGEVRHIADHLYLAGHETENLAELNSDETHFKHIFVKKGKCQIEIGGEVITLETGEILHLGKKVDFNVVNVTSDTDRAEFLTILHDPQDIASEIGTEWDEKWVLRKSEETYFGFWIGAFVDERFFPAKTAELAIGIKTLTGNVEEDSPHSHPHQMEINSVIEGAYEVAISDPYSSAEHMVDIRANEALIVGKGLFSGTRNIRLLAPQCRVMVIHTPNLQKSKNDKTRTIDNQVIETKTWSRSLLKRPKQ